MMDFTIPEGANDQMPEGVSILAMATYVCPFDTSYTGTATLVHDAREWLDTFDIHLMVFRGEGCVYEDAVTVDNMFIGLMEQMNCALSMEQIVLSLATENVNRISRWN